jgi:flagellar basal body-associated protein FliL
MPEDQESAAPEQAGAEVEKKSNKSGLMAGIIVGVMVLEGVGLYVAMKLLGSGPDQAPATEALAEGQKDQGCTKPEVTIAKMKVPNRVTGKSYIYDIEVAATLNAPPDQPVEVFKAEFEEKLKQNENAVRDRLNALIRGADPKYLDEPGLVMIRRQIKVELGKALGDEKVLDKVLLPRWTPIRADI